MCGHFEPHDAARGVKTRRDGAPVAAHTGPVRRPSAQQVRDATAHERDAARPAAH